MACTIADFGWTRSGSLISGAICEASPTSNIGLISHITFGTDLVGQQIYCLFDCTNPDGSTRIVYANDGKPYSVISAGTTSMHQDNVLKSTDPLGLYKVESVTILNSTKSVTYCWEINTNAKGCTNLTLTASTGGCKTSADCSDPSKMCIFGSCQSKNMVYAAGGLLALMMLMRQKR